MTNPFVERPLVDRLLASPLAFFLHPVHILLLRLRGPPHRPSPSSRPIRVVCISDTHTLAWADVPDGDLLIHAGDLSNDGSVREIQAAVDWLKTLPHAHKVVIAGNHDSYFDPRSRLDEDRDKSLASVSASTASIRSIDDFDSHRIDWGQISDTEDEVADIHYLQHSSVTLDFPALEPGQATRSLNVYGAPQIPTPMPMGPEHAFTYPPTQDAWTGTIPMETDILVTHTPPYTHRDLGPSFSIGCPYLLSEAWRVRPVLHVFGHVHFAHGAEPVFWDKAQRAWERISTRVSARGQGQRRLGFVQDLLALRNWADALRVLFYGFTGIIWSRVWGGEVNRGSGWMVNAAAMYKDTGVLRNAPQVFVL
jgi:Calcineurin-like phosphoesterase